MLRGRRAAVLTSVFRLASHPSVIYCSVGIRKVLRLILIVAARAEPNWVALGPASKRCSVVIDL
eukprot:5169759-Pleurochrysis_carterae.AAC.3